MNTQTIIQLNKLPSLQSLDKPALAMTGEQTRQRSYLESVADLDATINSIERRVKSEKVAYEKATNQPWKTSDGKSHFTCEQAIDHAYANKCKWVKCTGIGMIWHS